MPVLKIKTKIKLDKATLKAFTDALAQTGLSPEEAVKRLIAEAVKQLTVSAEVKAAKAPAAKKTSSVRKVQPKASAKPAAKPAVKAPVKPAAAPAEKPAAKASSAARAETKAPQAKPAAKA